MQTQAAAERFKRLKSIYRLLGTSEYALEVLQYLIQAGASEYMQIERYVRDLRKARGVRTTFSPRLVDSLLKSLLRFGLSIKDENDKYQITPTAIEFFRESSLEPVSYYWAVGHIKNFEQIPETEQQSFIDSAISILHFNGWRVFSPIDDIAQTNHRTRVLVWEGIYDQTFVLIWSDGRILCAVVVPEEIENYLRNNIWQHYRYTDPTRFQSKPTLKDDVEFGKSFMSYRLSLAKYLLDFIIMGDPTGKFRASKQHYIEWEEGIRFWHRFRPPLRILEKAELTEVPIEESDLSHTTPEFIWVETVSEASQHLRVLRKPTPEFLESIKREFAPDYMEMRIRVEKLERELELGKPLLGIFKHAIAILLDEKVLSRRSIQSAIDSVEEAIKSGEFDEQQIVKLREIEENAKRRWEKYHMDVYKYTGERIK